VLLAGCGGSKPSTASVRKLPAVLRRADVTILNQVLDLEYGGIAAYTAGIPMLTGSVANAAKHFLTQELSHAGELAGLVKQAGGQAHVPKASYALGHPRSAADVLKFLHAVETAVIAAYLDAIPLLSPGPVRAAVASLLANDAQHVSILRSTLGEAPLPSAFVTAAE
jgi:hypothetical protein